LQRWLRLFGRSFLVGTAGFAVLSVHVLSLAPVQTPASVTPACAADVLARAA